MCPRSCSSPPSLIVRLRGNGREWPRETLRSVFDKTAPPTDRFLLGLIPLLAGARSANVFSNVGCALRLHRIVDSGDLISRNVTALSTTRCYPSLSPTPLRGSLGQQLRGAAVSAAMIAPCVGEVLRAAVVARKAVFMRFRRGGGMLARVGGKLLHIAPTHRNCSAMRIANAPTPAQPPTKICTKQ